MNCPNCGNTLSDNAKFCPKCGTEIEPARGPEDTRTIQSWFGVDNILAVIATALMIVVMAVPFVNVNYVIGTTSFSLFDALDVTELIADREGLKVLFIVLFVAFILLFIIFKFVGKNRIPATIGCLGSWALFAVCVILVIVTNNTVDSSLEDFLDSSLGSFLGSYLDFGSGYNLLHLGAGFYVWIIAGFLEIVSLGLGSRKRRTA